MTPSWRSVTRARLLVLLVAGGGRKLQLVERRPFREHRTEKRKTAVAFVVYTARALPARSVLSRSILHLESYGLHTPEETNPATGKVPRYFAEYVK